MAIDCFCFSLQKCALHAKLYLSLGGGRTAHGGEKITMTGEDVMEQTTSILIADNSEEFCSSLCNALQRTGGFQVLGTATDGEQAIRQVLDKKPDVLVLDLMLSKQDGISVLKAISGM